VELDVLTDRDVGDAATVPFGQIGDRPQLLRLEHAVRNPDPHHQVANRLALPALAADRADTVALRVDAPPAEVRGEPLGRDRIPALAREALDVGIGLPGIQLALEPLDPLRLRLFHGLGHQCLQKRKPGGEPLSGPSSRLVSLVSTSPLRGSHIPGVPQGHLHPRFTSHALGRHATAGRIDLQDRVMDDDLVLERHDHLRPADRTA